MTKDTHDQMLRMRNIRYSYGDVTALGGVEFAVDRGEIHALVGEHRAGKSSLVKILSGALRKQQGEIVFEGKPVEFFTPQSAVASGIGMIYQDVNFIPELDTVENIFIGNMIRSRFGFVKRSAMRKKIEELSGRLSLDLDPGLPLFRLTGWQRHMVEILRVLIMEPRLLIFDELSNKLTPEEMKTVYQIMFEARNNGRSVIYISHDMDEVIQLADRVTILKNGYRRGTEYVRDLDKFMLFQLTYSFALNQKESSRVDTKFFLVRKHLEHIIRNLPIGAAAFDSSDRLQIINVPALELLDTGIAEARDSSFESVFRRIPAEVRTELAAAVERREAGDWKDVPLSDELVIDLKTFPLTDDENGFMGTAVLLQDISFGHLVTDYLIQTEKMASVAEVAVGVAHEINNPLYIIRNYVELLRGLDIGAPGEQHLSNIEGELSRIVEIVQSMLSFSRMKKLPGREVDLRGLIDDVLLLLRHRLTEKDITVRKIYSCASAFIDGDENRLKQLFINLIDNSIDAVLDAGSIAVELAAGEGCVEVRVRDNGYGIPADVQDRIFSPFFTTKVNRKNTGLGLAICRHIADEHDGEIAFSSVPGVETVFTLRFPAY